MKEALTALFLSSGSNYFLSHYHFHYHYHYHIDPVGFLGYFGFFGPFFGRFKFLKWIFMLIR